MVVGCSGLSVMLYFLKGHGKYPNPHCLGFTKRHSIKRRTMHPSAIKLRRLGFAEPGLKGTNMNSKPMKINGNTKQGTRYYLKQQQQESTSKDMEETRKWHTRQRGTYTDKEPTPQQEVTAPTLDFSVSVLMLLLLLLLTQHRVQSKTCTPKKTEQTKMKKGNEV